MVSEPSPLVEYVQQCVDDSRRWFPNTSQDLPFLILAMCGEAGELANVMKKVMRGSKQADAALRRELAEEAVDVLIYLMNIFAVLGVDPGKIYQQKRSFNERRFGNGDGRPSQGVPAASR